MNDIDSITMGMMILNIKSLDLQVAIMKEKK